MVPFYRVVAGVVTDERQVRDAQPEICVRSAGLRPCASWERGVSSGQGRKKGEGQMSELRVLRGWLMVCVRVAS